MFLCLRIGSDGFAPLPSNHEPVRAKTEAQRASSMEKIGKLRGPRGGEMMKPVLTDHNRKRGVEGGGRGEGSKRTRKVRKHAFEVT